ncbi:MFS transporter, partial [Pseudoflavonifractor phocaeensis]|uniref:MFS transporter n=1 Tax=Pseudoflavonifractor phocaeensis TaxID=1870988 RepID=UPI00195718EA
YITLTTSSGKMITLSTLCGFLPQILISLFAGVWIDRYSRKGIVMITDCFIASATLILAVFFLTGHKNIELLLVVLAIRSAGTGIQTPAKREINICGKNPHKVERVIIFPEEVVNVIYQIIA